MTRFELGEQFVELELVADAVHHSWGARGRARLSRVQQHADAPAAALAFQRQLSNLQHRGYRSGFHDERFEALLRENPDDLNTLRAYGDWLQEQRDPRGELIATMLAGRPHEELLRAHGDQFLPPSASEVRYSWRGGFIERAEYVTPQWGTVRRLLRHSSALLLRSISVINFRLDWGQHADSWNELAPWLPPTLKRIEVSSESALWLRRNDLTPEIFSVLVAVS